MNRDDGVLRERIATPVVKDTEYPTADAHTREICILQLSEGSAAGPRFKSYCLGDKLIINLHQDFSRKIKQSLCFF